MPDIDTQTHRRGVMAIVALVVFVLAVAALGLAMKGDENAGEPLSNEARACRILWDELTPVSQNYSDSFALEQLGLMLDQRPEGDVADATQALIVELDTMTPDVDDAWTAFEILSEECRNI